MIHPYEEEIPPGNKAEKEDHHNHGEDVVLGLPNLTQEM